MNYRNIDFIQQEAFCLYLHKTLSKALNDEDRNQHFRKDYEYFKKTCILFHQDNNNKLIFTFYVDCNGGGMQNQSVEQTDVGLLLLKEINIADKINNIEGIDLEFQFSKLNNRTTEDIQGYCSTTLSREFLYNIKDNYKYVSFYFEDIKKHFQKEIEEFEYNANLVLSVKEHAYLGEFRNLRRRMEEVPITNIENRICAYIDILGFTALIDLLVNLDEQSNDDANDALKKYKPFTFHKNEEEERLELEETGEVKCSGPYPDKNTTLKEVLDCQYCVIENHIRKSGVIKDDNIDAVAFKSALNISMFSDTIVLSYNFNQEEDDNTKLKKLTLFLEYVQQIQTYFLYNQRLTKGAITYGKMYHYGTMYGGGAFVKAYEIGDKENKYPRIILDNSIINVFKWKKNLNTILNEEYLCIDYLNTSMLQINKPIIDNNDIFANFKYSDEWLKFCCNHEDYTEGIREKYKYLCRIFNLSLS